MNESVEDQNEEKNLSNISASTSRRTKISPAKARRTVSFRDKCAGLNLETVHHVESLKQYNSTEEKGFNCLKCSLL